MEHPNPPEDLELRNIIDKLAQFVARNGVEFEQMTKNKQAGNPKFAFLFGGEYYHYYQFRVRSEQTGMMGPDDYGLKFPPQPPAHMNPPFYPGQPPPQAPFAPFNAHFGSPGGQRSPMLKPYDSPSPFSQNNLSHQPFPSAPVSQSLPLPPPMFQTTFSTNAPTPAVPFNDWAYKQQAPLMPGQPPLIDPSVNIENTSQANSNNLSQIAQIREAIAESEKNLTAQHKLIMEEEKEKKIEEIIVKSLDDELKCMCQDFNINLNEFDKILQPIIDTCRKESIANGKVWIFNKCHIAEHYEAVAKYILKKVTRDLIDSKFEAKLHLMYLINDLYNHCMRKGDDQLKESLNKIIVPAFSTAFSEADDDKKQKMTKLLKIWETNQYLDIKLLDQLKKTPQESMDAYKSSLYHRFADQINAITNELNAKYSKLHKQHTEFVQHQESTILQLQQHKPFQSLPGTTLPPNGTLQPSRPPFLPSHNSNLYLPPQVAPGSMAPRAPLPPQLLPPNAAVGPFQSHPQSANLLIPPGQQPPQLSSGYPGPYTQQGPGLPPPNYFSNSSIPNSCGTPFSPTILGTSSIPILQPMPAHSPSTGLPPHPQFPQTPLPSHVAQTEVPRQPYFDMPAGIMTQHIKLEDFDYKPINPIDMRVPLVTPPTERLLKALEAFYAPPSHEHPRNAEGWEKLGLYEFFKQKSNARKEYEAKVGLIESKEDDDSNENSDYNTNGLTSDKLTEDKVEKIKKESNRSPSPQKRRYKEFKEEKGSSGTSKIIKLKSRSRSPSISPPRDRWQKLKRSRSRSLSRSRSRSRSPKNRSISRRSRSRSPVGKSKFSKRRSRSKSPPPAFQSFDFAPRVDPQIPLSESNKGHQLLKKMGWSGAGGLGAQEHGIQDPISAGDVRDKTNQYRGIGNSGANDPFESYRRNKGQAYIQRIRDGRRD